MGFVLLAVAIIKGVDIISKWDVSRKSSEKGAPEGSREQYSKIPSARKVFLLSFLQLAIPGVILSCLAAAISSQAAVRDVLEIYSRYAVIAAIACVGGLIWGCVVVYFFLQRKNEFHNTPTRV
jgi:hypothetical protein